MANGLDWNQQTLKCKLLRYPLGESRNQGEMCYASFASNAEKLFLAVFTLETGKSSETDQSS